MVKYVAKNDTVFNFKFYRKGETVEAGELLDDNRNFERVDGSKPIVKPTSAVDKADEVAIRTRAKELKIANWHTKGVDKLLAEIAEAEAKAAAPTTTDGSVTPNNGGKATPDGTAATSEPDGTQGA